MSEEGITVMTEDRTGEEYYPVRPDGTKADKPLKLYPANGFDVNPGREAWQPDLDQFGEQKKIFGLAFEKRFGRVRDVAQLKDRLNGIQDNFKLMGVEREPVRSLKITEKQKLDGKWDGISIILPFDRHEQITYVLLDGRITTFEQADALAELCRCFGRTLGKQPGFRMVEIDRNFGNLVEAINEVWARTFYPDFVDGLKLETPVNLAKRIFKWRHSGYQTIASNFIQLMDAAGLDRQQLTDMVWELNLRGDPGKYEKAVRKTVEEMLPGINLPEAGLGTSLADQAAFEAWLRIIAGQRVSLGKPRGGILKWR